MAMIATDEVSAGYLLQKVCVALSWTKMLISSQTRALVAYLYEPLSMVY